MEESDCHFSTRFDLRLSRDQDQVASNCFDNLNGEQPHEPAERPAEEAQQEHQ
jgi:hypothetical protein